MGNERAVFMAKKGKRNSAVIIHRRTDERVILSTAWNIPQTKRKTLNGYAGARYMLYV
jgi:hypothetical protein